MLSYSILLTIHILSAVVWLSLLPADLVLRNSIRHSRGKDGEKKLVSVYMKLTNFTGMIGMTGILITGVILTIILPYYSFFDFSKNHWLATKQVIMVVLIVLVFAFLIPKAKKLRLAIGNDIDSSFPLTEDAVLKIKNLETIITLINVLVLINFLLAITHRFIGS